MKLLKNRHAHVMLQRKKYDVINRAEHQTKPEVLNPHFLCACTVKMVGLALKFLNPFKKSAK